MTAEAPSKHVILGRTSRAILDVIVAATAKGEVVTARIAAERSGSNINQTRTILRTLRDKDLVILEDFVSKEDRTFRYSSSDDAVERLAAGDKIKNARQQVQRSGSVEPLPPAIYAPLALKIASIDRAIVRWTGTSYRERKDLRAAGKNPDDVSEWSVRDLVINGKEVSVRSDEVGPLLRALRKTLVTPRFRRAQRIADRDLVSKSDGSPEDDDEGGEA